jgi:hypothetical protein
MNLVVYCLVFDCRFSGGLLCEHFGEEVEKHICDTNFIEVIIQLTKNFQEDDSLDIPGTSTRILLELCKHKSVSLERSIPKIPMLKDRIESICLQHVKMEIWNLKRQ